MLTINNVTIYKCTFCGKKMFVKGAAARHEQYCTKNPETWHKCFDGCKHLIQEDIAIGGNMEGDYVYNTRSFICGVLNQKMYPTKVERKGLLKKYPSSFADSVKMPKACPLFEEVI